MGPRLRAALALCVSGALLAGLATTGTSADAQSTTQGTIPTTTTSLPPVSCTSTPAASTEPFLIPSWTDAAGWNDPSRYGTIQVGDITGDGSSTLIGRNGAYIDVNGWSGGASGFQQWMPGLPGPALSDADNWNEPQYASTIHLADLDGNGTDELVARSSSGIQAWAWSGANLAVGTWSPLSSAGFAVPWSDANGYDLPSLYGSIRIGDVDGNGTDDVVGLDQAGTGIVAYSYDAATSSWTALPPLETGFDWRTDPSYYETLTLGDLDGDGADEVIGRTATGIQAWSLSGGTWTQLATTGWSAQTAWSDTNQWNAPEQVGSIRVGDVNGDGSDELLGLSNGGLVAWEFTGAPATGSWALVAPTLPLPAATYGQPQYYATSQVANVIGGSADEYLIRGPDGLEAYALTGGTWTQAMPTFTEMSDANGWNLAVRYPTIRAVTLGGGQAGLIARTNMGIETWVLRSLAPGSAATWVQPIAPMPSWAQTPIDTNVELQRAYQALNDEIGSVYWKSDVLPNDPSDPGTHYQSVWSKLGDTTLVNLLPGYVEAAPTPQATNITRDSWDTVQSTVQTWTNDGLAAYNYFLGPSSVLSVAQNGVTVAGLQLQDIYQQYFSSHGAEQAAAIISTILAAAISIAAAVIPVSAILSLPAAIVAGLTAASSGLSSWQGFANPGKAVQAQVSELGADLSGVLCNSVYYANDAWGQIVGDYGMLQAVAQLIGDGIWGFTSCPAGDATCIDPYVTAVSSAIASQELWAFQQLGTVGWRAGVCTPTAGVWLCPYSKDDPLNYDAPFDPGVTDGPVAWHVVEAGSGCLAFGDADKAMSYLQQTFGVQLSDIFTPLNGQTGQALNPSVGSQGWNLPVEGCA